MSDTNTFTIRGTFEKIETFTTKAGKEIITLVLATNGQYPQLVPCKCFGRMVDAAKDCSKGDMVEVTGRLGGREWNGKVYGENVAETVEVVGGKKDIGAEPGKTINDPGSDLPF